MKRRKILIDARWYGLEQRGIGRYAKELIDGLVTYQADFEIVLIVSQQNINLVPKVFKKVVAKSRWYTMREQWEIPWIIEKVKPDFFHAMHINVPLVCPVPYIVTVHDLQLLRIADQRATTLPPLLFKLKTMFAKFVVKHAILNATKIVAVSQFTADEIKAMVHGRLPAMEVIWEGTSALPQKNFRPNLLHSLNITKPYFVYCGAAYPHKNVELLIEAFNTFNNNHKNGYQLVLVGRTDYFYSRIQNSSKSANIIFAGYLPDSDVAFLYKQSLAFVIASNYEGFGLSPLEAQNCGAPVIAAKAGSLPEVLMDSVLYFEKDSANSLVVKLEQLALNEELRQQLIAKGNANHKIFSWSVMAKKISDMYRDL
jgi:glycosyltransferase involved in cell wall biosynthesis